MGYQCRLGDDDAVATLFNRPGYDTSARVPWAAAATGKYDTIRRTDYLEHSKLEREAVGGRLGVLRG